MAGNFTLPTENIDEVILRLLALEPNEIDELDYETYKNDLREILVEVTAAKRKIGDSEFNLIKGEFKRVRGKKGRFRIKPKKSKVTASGLGLGGVRKQVAGTQKRLMIAPVGGVPKETQEKVETVSKGRDSQFSALERISNLLDSIINTLTDINKNNKKRSDNERKDTESKKRGAKEKELESKTFEGVKNVVKGILKPFESIWDRIVKFITMVLLGRALLKLVDWFADPNNQGKIQSVIRFFKDHWPTLLALYLRFGTGIGRFIGRLGGILVKGAFRLGALAAKLAVKIGIGKAGGKLSKLSGFLGGKKGQAIAKGIGIAADVAVTAGTAVGIDKLVGSGTQKFSGGGLAVPKFSGGGFNFKGMMNGAGMGAMFGPLGMLLGGLFSSGIVKGPGGSKGDKIPAMLSDGEFVVSAGAVQKYGVDTFEAMNSAGGGTNVPKISEGIHYAAGGGYIGKVSQHLKQDEALSSLTKGKNDYIKPGGNSVETGIKWNMITPKTPIHSYVDSVGQPTIGWGSTFYDSILNGKKPVKPGDTITKSQADNILNTNIMNLGKEYSKKIPTWNKMSDDQKAGVTLVGYNAPYGPIGTYKNLTAALSKGDMVRAAAEVQRGGPSAARISMERKLILSGPKDLSKVSPSKSEKSEKLNDSQSQNKQQKTSGNWFSNLLKFKQGGLVPNRGSNYAPDGKKLTGEDTQLIAAQPGEIVINKKTVESIGADNLLNLNSSYKNKNASQARIQSITTLPKNQRIRTGVRPLPKPIPKPQVAGGGMGGRRGSVANPSNSQKPKTVNPTHPKGTRTAQSTLGIKKK